MPKGLRALLPICICICILFSGCEVKNETPFEQTEFPSAAGEIVIKTQPERVVCLSESYTEIIYELGYGDTLVAVGESCSYPKQVKKLDKVQTGIDFSTDEIISYSPNLLITQTSLSSNDLDVLYDKGIQVLTLEQTQTISGLSDIYTNLACALAGSITGPELGAQKYSELESKLEQIIAKIPDSEKTFLYSLDLEKSFATPDTFESEVLSLFFKNYITKGSNYETTFNDDDKIKPSVVFIHEPYETENAQDADVLKDIPAVKKGRVYILKSEYFAVKSARLADNIKKIAKIIYPKIDF